MNSVELIEDSGVIYAEIIWANTRVDHTTFFSAPESSFQFGLLAHKAGFTEQPHYHKPITRTITIFSKCSWYNSARSGFSYTVIWVKCSGK